MTTIAEAAAELADRFRNMPGYVADHEPTVWLRERVADVADWPPGCKHTRTGRNVAVPVIAPLWDRSLWCAVCASAARLPNGSPPDRQCDRCGRICAPALGDPIYPGSVQVGILLVVFGLCRDCHRKEAAR